MNLILHLHLKPKNPVLTGCEFSFYNEAAGLDFQSSPMLLYKVCHYTCLKNVNKRSFLGLSLCRLLATELMLPLSLMQCFWDLAKII